MHQEALTYIWQSNDMDDGMKIFGLYSANILALAFSVSEVNGFLQMLVMSATLIFTVIQIYKAIKK
jgi:hypothetical protein